MKYLAEIHSILTSRLRTPRQRWRKPSGFQAFHGSLFLATLSVSMLSLALPVMTLQVYDRILPNPGSGTLNMLIAGVCIAVLLEMVMRLARAFLVNRNSAAYEHRMACNAMKTIINADLSCIKRTGVGEYLAQIKSIGAMRDFHNGQITITAAELLFVPVALLLITYIAGALVLVPLSILALFSITSWIMGKRLKCSLDAREKADNKRFDFLVETLEGVHTLKAFALEKAFERRYEALQESSVLRNYDVTIQTASTFNYAATFSHLMVVSVIIAGAYSVLQGTLTTGSLIATLLLAGRVMQPVQKALVTWTRFQDYQLASEQVKALLDIRQQRIEQRSHKNAIAKDGTLALRHVAFAYPSAPGEQILRDIRLTLQRGDAALISGRFGCGKSTLCGVVSGLLPVTHGEVLVDGESLYSYAPHELARHMAYIQEQPIIFRGTIRDNITAFGTIREEDAREVAAHMEIDAFIAQLPAGFDTFLHGNDADSIPPGFKQRIAIVRALATKPRIIIYNNAERNLDSNGYMIMHRFLARLKQKVSMILISDDHNIQALATKRYVLNQGTLQPVSVSGETYVAQPYKELSL